MKIAYLNNRFLALDKARVPILDRGFQYGDGVFETMRSYNGIVFRLEKHTARLLGSLKALGIRPKVSMAKIQKIVHELLKKNRLKDAYVKIIVTRGGRGPTLAVYALPYAPLPKDVYEKGIRLCVSRAGFREKSEVTQNKTLNYLRSFLCREEAKKRGFDDAVFVNTGGFVSEASSSNIFLVEGKKIYTPSRESGILPGITREEIISLAAKRLKSKVNENFIKISALYTAGEVFLTNSLAEIVPVVKVEKTPVGNGKPGPVTKKLMELFKISVKKYKKP
jgi:branched-chain amino acid aminotransferase